MPPRLGRDLEDLRRHNLSAVLSAVHLGGPQSRAELTDRLGLNRSTIAGLVATLVESGHLVESVGRPDARGGAGRPSHVVAPRAASACVLAVHVDVEQVTVARVGLGGRVEDRVVERAPASSGRDAVEDLILRMVRTLPADPAPVVGVGVAMPALVQQPGGVVRRAPNLGWTDEPFERCLGERLRTTLGLPGLPVLVANDANLGVTGEQLRGSAVAQADVVFLSGWFGLGCGVVIGGTLVQGAAGFAGELGHMVVAPDGPRCRCGNQGCWETRVSALALATPLGLDPTDPRLPLVVLGRAADGDRAAQRALQDVAQWYGAGLAVLVNAFNPSRLVVGGLWRDLYPHLADQVLGALRARAMAAPMSQVQVVLPGLGADSILVGASELAFGPLLADPLGAVGAASPPEGVGPVVDARR